MYAIPLVDAMLPGVFVADDAYEKVTSLVLNGW